MQSNEENDIPDYNELIAEYNENPGQHAKDKNSGQHAKDKTQANTPKLKHPHQRPTVLHTHQCKHHLVWNQTRTVMK